MQILRKYHYKLHYLLERLDHKFYEASRKIL